MTQAYAVTPPSPTHASEAWAPVPSCPGYEASTQGRIRSLDRVVVGGNGARAVRGRVLKLIEDRNGYMSVRVSGGRRVSVHVLVLETFVGPRPDGFECCHWDDNRQNNALSNLRWDTHAANVEDRKRNGNYVTPRKLQCAYSHPLDGNNVIQGKNQRYCRSCATARQKKRKLVLSGEYDGDFQALADAAFERMKGTTPRRLSTAPHGIRPVGHACDDGCHAATSPAASCTCVCGGRYHGAALVRGTEPTGYALRVARHRGDPFALLPTPGDTEAF